MRQCTCGAGQAQHKTQSARAAGALDTRLQAIECQLGTMAGDNVGDRIAAAEWRTAQVND